jgi:hypothetical protein
MPLMREYSHPDWDMTLIIPAEGAASMALSMLGET